MSSLIPDSVHSKKAVIRTHLVGDRSDTSLKKYRIACAAVRLQRASASKIVYK